MIKDDAEIFGWTDINMGKTEISDLTILIADKNSFIAKTLFSILEAFGAKRIILCDDLDDAEKKFHNVEIDCIFVDFMMDKRAGLDFIRKIRTKPSTKNDPELPIILETGVTEIHSVILARDAGVTEIISKPFSPAQVLQKLDSAINRRREFIQTDDFIGPNRRRHKENNSEWAGDNDRRGTNRETQKKAMDH